MVGTDQVRSAVNGETGKPVVYKTTAVLWSAVSAVLAAGALSALNASFISPIKDIEAMKERIIILESVLESHGTVMDVDIPARFGRAFEQIAEVRAENGLARAEIKELSKRNFRPDPFTGLSARRMEDRVTARVNLMLKRVERLEATCVTTSRTGGP